MKYVILMFLAFLAILFSNTGFASSNLEAAKKYVHACKHVGGTPVLTVTGVIVCLKSKVKA